MMKESGRYDSNIRGFILYILGEINLENKGRGRNNRISEILHIQRFKADKYLFLDSMMLLEKYINS